MNQNETKLIKNKIEILVGAKGSTIGRAASMACMGFRTGDSEYALHLQTAFRICEKDRILIAGCDMFEPTEALKNSPSFDWDTFQWDVQGFNRYDEWVKQFKKEYQQLTVQKVLVSPTGDLTIAFDRSIVLEVFPNSATEECWRFFERNSDAHLVVTGRGIDESV